MGSARSAATKPVQRAADLGAQRQDHPLAVLPVGGHDDLRVDLAHVRLPLAPCPLARAHRGRFHWSGNRPARRSVAEVGWALRLWPCASTSPTTRWSPTSSPRCATWRPTRRRSAGSPTSWSPCWPTRRPGRAHRARSQIRTPVAPTTGVRLASPKPLVVPILRAGLGMLDGMVRLLPTAEVGFLGMIRDEETLQASTYATRLPEDLSGRQCYVLDPMLATGGTLVAAIQFLHRPRRRRHHRDLPARRARGPGAAGEALRRPGRAGHRGHRRARRAAQRARLHRARASATPATASTAWSEPPSCPRSRALCGRSALRRPRPWRTLRLCGPVAAVRRTLRARRVGAPYRRRRTVRGS